jgi:hypothetical protein
MVQEAQQELVAINKHTLRVVPSEEKRHTLGDNMTINFSLDIDMGWFIRCREMYGRMFGS